MTRDYPTAWQAPRFCAPRRLLLLAVGPLLIVGPGCGGPPAPASMNANASDAAAQPAGVVDRDVWYVNFILGSKVGYEKTSIRRASIDGREVIRLEGLSHTSVRRDGQEINLDMTYRSTETLGGELIDFEMEYVQGPVPTKTRGRLAGDTLVIETTTQGKQETSRIAGAAGCGGFFAVQQSLLNKPMQPGETRNLRAIIPGFNVVGENRMTALDFEQTELPTGPRELLRIDVVTTAPGGASLNGALWIDRTGELHKQRIDAMNLESFLATEAEAKEEAAAVSLDLVSGVGVPVDKAIPSPHATKRVVYLVRLKEGDPAAAFVAGPAQQVESVDPHTARLKVWATRPDGPAGNPAAKADPPGDEDRQPNNWIQSDNPKIAAMAKEAAGAQTDPWQTAVAIERYVRGKITQKNYSQAFASAAEVADSLEGDCSEHAVLLAALARAKGIPARVAMGLVYKDRKFYYHMWNEVYVGDRWIALDGTLGQGGVGAAHLKLGHSNLHGASAFTSFLPLLNVIGRLEVEVEEVE